MRVKLIISCLNSLKMTKYQVELYGTLAIVTEKERDYHLTIADYNPGVAIFTINLPSEGNVLVTGRDITDYHPEIRDLEINPSLLYVEVGAGLGGFIPNIIQKTMLQKPIVIDPVDYTLLLEMLEFAETLPLEGKLKERVKVHQERCKIILNSDKVRLINLKLEEAFNQHPELEGIADVVIDHFAASQHLFFGSKQEIIDLEHKLLKPNGTIYDKANYLYST